MDKITPETNYTYLHNSIWNLQNVEEEKKFFLILKHLEETVMKLLFLLLKYHAKVLIVHIYLLKEHDTFY